MLDINLWEGASGFIEGLSQHRSIQICFRSHIMWHATSITRIAGKQVGDQAEDWSPVRIIDIFFAIGAIPQCKTSLNMRRGLHSSSRVVSRTSHVRVTFEGNKKIAQIQP